MLNCRFLFVGCVFLVLGCGLRAQNPSLANRSSLEEQSIFQAEDELQKFIDSHVKKLAALEKEMNFAYWQATTNGRKDEYDRVNRLEVEIRNLYSNSEHFQFLARLRREGKIRDPLLRRQLSILYLSFFENQVDVNLLSRLTGLANRLEQRFYDFRTQFDGEEFSSSQLLDVLKSESKPEIRRKAWEAYVLKGAAVREDILELVRIRNQMAQSVGFEDYYQMSLELSEQDPEQIKTLFEQLARQTDEVYTKAIHKMNIKLAKKFGVSTEAIRPWHYDDPFFEEAPVVDRLQLDQLFNKRDLIKRIEEFFLQSDLEVGDVLQRSDLYIKKGKMSHAYCIHTDRSGDVRILANFVPGESWTRVLLHELGHALFEKNLDQRLPWLLRKPAHDFLSEAISELFGRLTLNATWLEKVVGVSGKTISLLEKKLDPQQRLSVLVFTRFGLVMANFERELYQNPNQDLDQLWWNLKRRYQMQSPPDRCTSDWAAKIHLALWPAYYQNYLLGQLAASQLLATMRKGFHDSILNGRIDFVKQPVLGNYLIEKIFKPGMSRRWDELLQEATGEPLTSRYFTKQFFY